MKQVETIHLLKKIISSLPESVVIFDTQFNFLVQGQMALADDIDVFVDDFKKRNSGNTLLRKITEEKHSESYIINSEDKSLSIVLFLSSIRIEEVVYEYIYVKILDATEELRNISQLEKMQMIQINNDKMNGLAEISAGISHEINNPLTVIVAKVQHIKNLLTNFEKNQVKIFEGLDRIYHHSDRITKIIRSLKNFSRDTSNDPLDIVSVSAIIEDSTNLLSEQIKNRGIQIRMTAITTDFHVRCRPSEITQIVVNLIKNSIDALADVRQPEIEIKIEKIEARKIRFSFTDNGSGIDLRHRGQIFKSFYTTKPAGAGTGLGLSLSKHLARKNDGDLYLNEDKTGTCFCLELGY